MNEEGHIHENEACVVGYQMKVNIGAKESQKFPVSSSCDLQEELESIVPYREC